MNQFFGNWKNQNDLVKDFEDDSVLDYDILIAGYSYQNYEGDSFVLAKKDGQIFANEASHCSCYGLEGKWNPAIVNVEYLKNRINKGSSFVHGSDDVQSAIIKFIGGQP